MPPQYLFAPPLNYNITIHPNLVNLNMQQSASLQHYIQHVLLTSPVHHHNTIHHHLDECRRAGRLSISELVSRGQRIETILKTANGNDYPQAAAMEKSRRRRLTSDIFRAYALVYLYPVISGDHPQCPEIMANITETHMWLPDDRPSILQLLPAAPAGAADGDWGTVLGSLSLQEKCGTGEAEG
ncbi:hypothetical protein CY34DRAFT_12680 [Suillus luteus UH-Slu-Lm8-n1]|uniref:Uncharacterized protein n=1 Tax=Suillus luteus UH-Slu-Lm8-n1 TaxID=930992 RepID=A0A0D0B6D6_9AGAM|nr:hypothetical protein CY34DRAFT_12680 [Suillus luteus UH-Slu-Lm8-n1]